MKYSEATKAIKGLSKKYSICEEKNSYSYRVILKDTGIVILEVPEKVQYTLNRYMGYDHLEKLPYSHKLYMILAELAMTPLDKRKDERKWNVIVGNDSSKFNGIICWGKEDSNHVYLLCLTDSNSLAHNDDVIFTDEEFSNLIKYIKKLPDGEWQAKVAQHGKTLVKGE